MRYTENVYKRKRNRKVVYDGILRYYDENGERITKHCERKTRTAALDAMRDLRSKLEAGGPKAVAKANTTFTELADYCLTEIYREATYNEDGEKLQGVRNSTVYQAHIKHLKKFFAHAKLEHITIADIKRYRSQRLQKKRVSLVYREGRDKPERVTKNIDVATVERELTTLRAMLNEAIRNNWGIQRNPFKLARPNEIFKKSSRKKRTLFLTFAQEKKLLSVCQTEDRRHLRALILTAVDTGARYGELAALRKSQLDWKGRGTIRGLRNYKGLGGDKEERNAGMTPRVRAALLDVIQHPPKQAFKTSKKGTKPSEDLVFGIRRITTTWKKALKDAGLAHLGFHFHDLRHTPGTRVKEILALPIIQKALGHKDPKLTAEIYINDVEGDIMKFAEGVEHVVTEGYKLLEQQEQELLRQQHNEEPGSIDQQSQLIS